MPEPGKWGRAGGGGGKDEESGNRVTPGSLDQKFNKNKKNPSPRDTEFHLNISLREGEAGTAEAGVVKRSASDAQDLYRQCCNLDKQPTDKRNKLASSIVKRSRSFQKIFSHSMLSKSKEYNFQ